MPINYAGWDDAAYARLICGKFVCREFMSGGIPNLNLWEFGHEIMTILGQMFRAVDDSFDSQGNSQSGVLRNLKTKLTFVTKFNFSNFVSKMIA